MLSRDCRRLVGIALVLSTTFMTMPISAADFTSGKPVLGSISTVGAVELRGVGISQEGTLFAGDTIRSHEKGYAKVLLGTGSKIELGEKTDITVNRDKEGVKIAMNTGNLGFTAKSSLRVDVAPFEVLATDGAAANVAVMSPTTGGVRAINGKVTVRNLKTQESFVLLKGHEQLLSLDKGVHSPSLADVASNVPPTIPPVPSAPQTPAGQTKNVGLAMDTGAWLAVGGVALLGGAVIYLGILASHKNDRISALNAQNNSLKQQLNAQSAKATAAQAASTASQINAVLAQTTNAINNATNVNATTKTTLTTQAANLQLQVSNAASAISNLQNQLTALQTQLQSASGSQATAIQNQINVVTNNLNGQVAVLNQAIANLNLLIQSAVSNNVAGVPNVTIQPIPPASIVASASIPT